MTMKLRVNKWVTLMYGRESLQLHGNESSKTLEIVSRKSREIRVLFNYMKVCKCEASWWEWVSLTKRKVFLKMSWWVNEWMKTWNRTWLSWKVSFSRDEILIQFCRWELSFFCKNRIINFTFHWICYHSTFLIIVILFYLCIHVWLKQKGINSFSYHYNT